MTRPTPQTPASDTPPSGAGHAPARADGPPLPKQPWRAKAPAAATPPVAAGPSPVVASTTQAAAEQDPARGVRDADSALLAGPGEPRLFASREVIRYAGITCRQLDYWERQGYITHQNGRVQSGFSREWARGEMDVACRIARLIAAGLSLGVAARVARSAPGRLELAPGVVIEVAA